MTSRPTILTVILNWRTPAMTIKSVEAARRAMSSLNGEIIVVDNDSGDGSCDRIRGHAVDRGWTDVRVVQSHRNGGFGAGNNVGIRCGLSDTGRPDFVYILNSDAFPATDSIARLVDHLQAEPRAGLAGSYIHGTDGEPHLTTFRFPSIAGEFEGACRLGPVSRLLARSRVPVPTPQVACRVDWLAGASLMIRHSVLEEIGLFDETFFLYFEETDLCRRALSAGHEVHFVPESRVAHIGSATTKMKEWRQVPGYWFDSRLHYFCKTHGPAYAGMATAAHVAGGTLHRVRCLLTGRRPVDPPGFLSTLIRHDLGVLWRRRPRRRAPPHLDGVN